MDVLIYFVGNGAHFKLTVGNDERGLSLCCFVIGHVDNHFC